MDSLKIDLKSLEEGATTIERDLDDAYFAATGGSEVSRGRMHASITIDRADKVFDIVYHIEGTAVIPCDRCLDDMEQPICADDRIVAKLGSEGIDDENIAIDENDGVLDLTWPIYESIALSIPVKHVHAPGKCNPAMIKVLEEHSAARSSEEEDGERPQDPRWDALKKLKNNN